MMGIRKGLKRSKKGVMEECLMMEEVKWGEERWKVGVVYVGGRVENVLGRIREEIKKTEGETSWIVGGDFNARTLEMRALKDGEEGVRKMSKDKVINRQREKLIKWLGEKGWGAKKDDKEGEMTFTGWRGESIIVYVIGNRMTWERIEKLEAGEEIESDHQSVTVWVGKVVVKKGGRGKGRMGEGWNGWTFGGGEEGV